MTELTDSSLSDYLQDLVLEAADVEEFLEELVQFSVQTLSEGSEILCGITLLRRHKVGTVVSSSPAARTADEMQYKFAEGPCLEATRTHTPVHVPDMRIEQRWPEYTATMAEAGILSAYAIPFELEGETRAALNLYSVVPGFFGDSIREIVEAHVNQTSKAFRLAVRMSQRADRADDLNRALESRTTIDLAVGILMGQNRCSQNEAFNMLQSASSSRNMKLRDLAAQLVAQTGGQDPETHFNP
ncbi:GAF and ANTAR domain-containing protein [Arthrobacter sp. AET 35A]|uniref:GAF and ANTAR domain-containing protein n=1 Tax=Arthrobacter sp. AET 35A TaxID=2292643 RepID=UPI001786A22A|nr:GAF and ANTAR domain-containing protein [Arthrobacter sp. AET 35A]MBE0011086.1 ANTAR domain-containing protein [Arthrobacter sp. AET 35A]